MAFLEKAGKVKEAAANAAKAARKVKNIIKFFGTVVGQVIMWVLIILFAIILLYILANTIAKGVAKLLGIENPGLKETADYQILLELQNSGYNTLMDSKELQEYTAYEYNVLMDIARYMEEKGVYVDAKDPARFDESIYNTEEYRRALAERRAAGMSAGFDMPANETIDNAVLERWQKAVGNKAEGDDGNGNTPVTDEDLSNEEVKKELYYKIVDNGQGETTEKALVPYLRLERGAYRNTYYLLDKSTTNNLLNENGEINTDEVKKLENAVGALENIEDMANLPGSWNDLVARMGNIDGYYLNAELNRNILSKALTRNKGFGDSLSLTKEYKHDQLYYDRVDAGSCTYDIPLKVIVDRFLPKATLLSSWYMLKGEDKEDKEKGPAGKVLEQIRSIYDEACLSGEEAKTGEENGIIIKKEDRNATQKEEDDKQLGQTNRLEELRNGDKAISDYTNDYTSLIMQRAYLDIAEQYPWYFDKVKTIKPITDLVCGIDLSSIFGIGAWATTGDNNEKLLDPDGNELDSSLSNAEISDILSGEYVLNSGETVTLVGVTGEGYIRDIPDDTGMVKYPDIKDDEESVNVSGYYYAMKNGEKVLITEADLSKIISQIETRIIAKIRANLSSQSKIPQKNIKVSIGSVNVSSPKAVFTCEEVKFPISQLVLRRNLPTYFPKEAKTWSREVIYNNNIKFGPKFLDNSTLCLIPNCNEYGYQKMEIIDNSKWRTKMYAPVFPTVRENDVIAMLSEWENSANEGVYTANCYIRDLYKLIEYSKQEKDKNGKAYVDEDSYTYVNISDEILLFNENTIDQIYWLNHLLATEEDPILPEETLTMRTKLDVMYWQNVEYELYDECYDEETNTYKVYALWPLGNYISRARYAALANATKDGQDYTEVWGGYQYNNRHAGVDLYGRRIVEHMRDAYKDGFDQDLKIDDSKVKNTETKIVMDGRTEIFKDADSAVYAYELYRLSKASGSGDSQVAKSQLDSIVEKLSKDTPIVAVAPGIVTGVHGGPVCGFRVQIEHTVDEKCKTLYVHMKRWPNVQKGQYVGAGTVIGYEGTTGKSGAVHLHFEIKVGGHNQIYPIPYLYPMFSPFYNEEKAEEAEYGLESEYMSLVRTVYPVGQIIGEGVVTSPETKGVDQSVKQRRFVYLPDGTPQQTQIQQVEAEDGKVKIKNYVPSYPIADSYLKLYTYEQNELTDGVEKELSGEKKTDGSNYKGQEFIQDLYYDRDFINYFKHSGDHVVEGSL